MTELRAPFPWFGGKRRVADVVWRAFGLTLQLLVKRGRRNSVCLAGGVHGQLSGPDGSQCSCESVFRVGRRATGALRRTLRGPPTLSSRGDQFRHEFTTVLVHMLREVARLCERFEVVECVVELVAVLVVDNVAARQRAIGGLPNDLSAQLPRVRLSYFDPGAAFSTACVPCPDSNGANWQVIVRRKAAQPSARHISHAGKVATTRRVAIPRVLNLEGLQCSH